MDPISNVDHLVLLLRQRIIEAAKGRSTGSQPRSTGSSRPDVGGVAALAAVDGVSDRQMRRAVIQHLLTDQFGAALLNEAKFQLIVDRVVDTIDGDVGAASLMSRVVTDLRAAAR